MTIRAMTHSERLYSYTQSGQIQGQTGCIGRLRADTEKMLSAGVRPYASALRNRMMKNRSSDLIPVANKELILVLLPRTTGRFSRFGLKVNKLRYYAAGYIGLLIIDEIRNVVNSKTGRTIIGTLTQAYPKNQSLTAPP